MLTRYLSFPVAASDLAHVGHADVDRCLVRQALRPIPDLAPSRGQVRDSDHCSSKVFLPGYTKVILHANNVFLQGVADQGLLTFALTSIALTLIFQRLFIGLSGDLAAIFLTCLACALFILASYLVETKLRLTSLQHVVAVICLPSPGQCHRLLRS